MDPRGSLPGARRLIGEILMRTSVNDDRVPARRMPWPSTALAAAEQAFRLITCEPHPLSLDCRGIPGLPDAEVPLGELRRLLLHDGTSRETRDAVWRRLVVNARSGVPAWRVAAVGMATPGLRRMAGLLARSWHGDSSDRDSEMITGFLDRMADIDLNHSRIAGKLIDAGARAVKAVLDREATVEIVHTAATWSVPPRPAFDHPDWVLARAVAAGVIAVEEWELISRTRLEEQSLHAVAEQLAVSTAVAAAWRRAAERKVAKAITGGELDRVSLTEVMTRMRRRAAHRKWLAAVAIRQRSTGSTVAPAAA
jgi:hypothetical protein